MASRGLLSRLSTGAQEAPDEAGSILEHLKVLLNTRKGESVTAPGFGLVDFSDLVHSFPASLPTLQASIKATILEFEPRLRNVNVRPVADGDPLVLKFEISAQPVLKNGKVGPTFRFQTAVNAGGQFKVGTDG